MEIYSDDRGVSPHSGASEFEILGGEAKESELTGSGTERKSLSVDGDSSNWGANDFVILGLRLG